MALGIEIALQFNVDEKVLTQSIGRANSSFVHMNNQINAAISNISRLKASIEDLGTLGPINIMGAGPDISDVGGAAGAASTGAEATNLSEGIKLEEGAFTSFFDSIDFDPAIQGTIDFINQLDQAMQKLDSEIYNQFADSLSQIADFGTLTGDNLLEARQAALDLAKAFSEASEASATLKDPNIAEGFINVFKLLPMHLQNATDEIEPLRDKMNVFYRILQKNSIAINEIDGPLHEFFIGLRGISQNATSASTAVEQLTKKIGTLTEKKGAVVDFGDAFSRAFGFQLSEGLYQVARGMGAIGVGTDALRSQKAALTAVHEAGIQLRETVGNDSFGIGGGMGAIDRRTDELYAFRQAAIEMGGTTASSVTEATEAMADLARMRVTRNIDELQELGTTSMFMSQAFGVSTSEANQLVKQLSLVGGLGTTEVRAAADSISNVRDQMGLTAEEAREATNVVANLANKMSVFGGTVRNIETVTEEVARMTAAFTQAGLQASQVGELMNKMMDPSQLEENVLLFQGLGMSAGDAMSMMMGEGQQLENMTGRMVDLARNLKSQYGGNVFALQEMAKQYGMSLEQVQQLSQLTEEQIALQQEQSNLEQEAAEARSSMTDAFDQLLKIGNVLMQQFLLPFIEGATWLLNNTLVPIARTLGRLGESAGPIGKTFSNILKGIIGGFLLWFFLLRKKGGGGILGGLNNLKNKLFGIGKEGGGAIAKAGEGVKKFGESIRTVPVKQMLAVGAAMMMIGIAIGIVVFSIVMLVKAVGEANLTFGQLAGIALILVVVMAGMAGMLYLLGTAAAASAGPLLAAGFAMLMIGAAVALIIGSIAYLIQTIATVGASMEQLTAVGAMVATVMLGMIGLLIVLGIVGAVAAPGILAAGFAMLMIGIAIALIVGSITLLISQIAKLSGEQMAQLAGVLGVISTMVLLLSLAMMGLAVAMTVMGVSALIFLGALVIMAGGIAIIFLLGKATNNLAENLFRMGDGLRMIAESGAAAIGVLTQLREVFSGGFDFSEAFSEQMRMVAQSMAKIAVLAPIISLVLKPEAGTNAGPGTTEDGGMGAVVNELQTTNKHLEDMKGLMDGISTLVYKIAEKRPRSTPSFAGGATS